MIACELSKFILACSKRGKSGLHRVAQGVTPLQFHAEPQGQLQGIEEQWNRENVQGIDGRSGTGDLSTSKEAQSKLVI